MGIDGVRTLSSNIGGGNGTAIPTYANLAAFPAGTVIGQLGIAGDTGLLYSWDGSAWRLNTNSATYPVYEDTSSVLQIIGSTNSILGATLSIQVNQASGATPGFLSSANWTTFNGKQDAIGYTPQLVLGYTAQPVLGYTAQPVLGYTAQPQLSFYPVAETTSSVLQITGITTQIPGSTLLIQVNQASGTTSGFLSSANWTTFNYKQPEFNGVIDSSKILPIYDSATQVFGVTCLTGAQVSVLGDRYDVTTQNLPAHGTTTGQWFFYYDASGTLTQSQTFWNLLTTAPVASLYFNAGTTAGLLFDERHPGVYGMDNKVHEYLHLTRGTQVRSGGSISGMTFNTAGITALSYAVGSVVLDDEDLTVTLNPRAKGGSYRIMYQTGTAANPVWQWNDTSVSGILADATNPYYNQLNGATWQLTPIAANNTWFNYYVFAMQKLNPNNGIVALVGQNTFGSAALAQAEDPSTGMLNVTKLSSEGAYLGRLTYQRISGGGEFRNTRIISSTLLRTNTISVTGTVPGNHSSLSGRSDVSSHPASAISTIPSGNLAATDVQTALDELQTDVDTRVIGITNMSATAGPDGGLGISLGYIYPTPASATFGGVMTAGDQSLKGNKTFLDSVSSPILKFPGTTTTMSLLTPATIAGYTLTWPAAQGATSTVLGNDGTGALAFVSVPSPPVEVDNGNSGASKTLNLSTGVVQKLTMTAGCTLTISNPSAYENYLFRIVQSDGSGFQVAWPVSVKWPSASAPVLTTGTGKQDMINLYYDGISYFLGSFVLNF